MHLLIAIYDCFWRMMFMTISFVIYRTCEINSWCRMYRLYDNHWDLSFVSLILLHCNVTYVDDFPINYTFINSKWWRRIRKFFLIPKSKWIQFITMMNDSLFAQLLLWARGWAKIWGKRIAKKRMMIDLWLHSFKWKFVFEW